MQIRCASVCVCVRLRFLNRCYYLILVEDFSGGKNDFFFFFKFNFRPSVGAWLPATGVKQRLVYANGQRRDAAAVLSLPLSLSLYLSHISSDSPLLSKIKTFISLYPLKRHMQTGSALTHARTHTHRCRLEESQVV